MLLCITRTMCRDPSPNQQTFQKVFNFASERNTLGTSTRASFYVDQILERPKELISQYVRTLNKCSKIGPNANMRHQLRTQTDYLSRFLEKPKKSKSSSAIEEKQGKK